jgi:hypothetical protein
LQKERDTGLTNRKTQAKTLPAAEKKRKTHRCGYEFTTVSRKRKKKNTRPSFTSVLENASGDSASKKKKKKTSAFERNKRMREGENEMKKAAIYPIYP